MYLELSLLIYLEVYTWLSIDYLGLMFYLSSVDDYLGLMF